jgi:hypothetical protein
MAREKPLDVTVVQAWLAAWDESDLFSEAAIHHFQSFIADPHCLVVLTLRVGREPRSLVFRRVKRVVEAHQEPSASNRPKIVFDTVVSPRFTWRDWAHSLSLASSMFVSPVPPVAPPIGQLWHQTGVESETVPKLERVLRWDGADWVAAGYVSDSPIERSWASRRAISRKRSLQHIGIRSGSTANSSIPTTDRPGGTRSPIFSACAPTTAYGPTRTNRLSTTESAPEGRADDICSV